MKLYLYILICFLCCGYPSRAQTTINIGGDRTLDSLLMSLNTSVKDTNKVNALIKISKRYMNTFDYPQAIKYAEEAQKLAKELDFKKGLSLSFHIIGSIGWYKGDYEQALHDLEEGLKIRIETGDKNGIAASYNNIGLVYHSKGDIEKALENHLKSLSIKEELGDIQGAGTSYNNIGNIYLSQKNYSKALTSYTKYFQICEKSGDKYGVATASSNIGNVHNHLGDYVKAMQSHSKALILRQELGDKKGLAQSYINIANVYGQQGDYEKALINQLKSLAINKEIEDKNGVGLAHLNIGITYTELNKRQEALEYLKQALEINRVIGNKEQVKDVYIALANLYSDMNDYESAYAYHKRYADLKDTLLNEQSNRQIMEMNTRYDSEKKDKELIKKDSEISKRQVEAEKKNIQRNAFIVGFSIVLILALFIFRGYRQKQATNLELKNTNELIENQKGLVEDRNKKITDSINYAKRIQQAILPSGKVLSSVFSNSFVLLKPKDIVSGDFYWIAETGNQSILIAAVDCTGHGVPGALMSMMGYNLLEQVVKEHHVYQPAAVLDELSVLLADALHNTGDGEVVTDGMDAALCKIDYKNNSLEFAGARNSLYLIRNGFLKEFKADRRSVGASYKQSKFTNHHANLEKGDSIYIFSDGFADQKGGPENKKFFYQPFQQLILNIHQKSMKEQQRELEKVITEWKGTNEQTDDILVICIRV